MSSSTADLNLPSFVLPCTDPEVRVRFPRCLDADQILQFPAFKIWLRTLNVSLSSQTRNPNHPFKDHPYVLRSIEVQSADFFSSRRRLGFLKLQATITNDFNQHLPGSVFMRGGSVAMLIILTPTDTDDTSSNNDDAAAGEKNSGAHSGGTRLSTEEYVILTIQPRIAIGSLSFIELPAGMIDDSGTFSGAAAKEIVEETGLGISTDDLVDMTQLAISSNNNNPSTNYTTGKCKGKTTTNGQQRDYSEESDNDNNHLQEAIYPSPGACDEFIPIFLARRSMPRDEIESLRGKLTGLRDQGEKITLKVVPLSEVWKVAARDGKTLAAMALYQGLKAEGMI
ncbi:uncharacterized protein PV06_00006 [Exophiala oligosperma]|uniref:Uncharacterized protein n=1 Tax=Exophiala oligosperma TaxID=215243 RepID=A0A0D2EH60_9EURO|nr:uncharacterized protein PV06_00006 [Exophiala oligosperma]KIW47294.1 hypothetical protein PV06_00006 [Exophiala oligosperma]